MFMDIHSGSRRGLRVHDEAFPAWARREMRARRLVCFLAEAENGEIVGGGSVWLREVQPRRGFGGGKVPYLMSMYTSPAHRRMGVGSMVVRRAIEWSRKRGYGSLTLHASRKGRPIYEKFGWKATTEMKLELGVRPRPVARRPRRSGR